MTSAPSEFVCPLTLEVMDDPVMTRWGHNFERMELLTWLQRHDQCPLTRNPLTLRDIIGNRALKHRIRQWRMVNQLCNDRQEDNMHDLKIDDIPLVVMAKSSKTVIRALEEHEDPSAKSVLKTFKKERREKRRKKRAESERVAAATPAA